MKNVLSVLAVLAGLILCIVYPPLGGIVLFIFIVLLFIGFYAGVRDKINDL